jgi:hypothetical protein
MKMSVYCFTNANQTIELQWTTASFVDPLNDNSGGSTTLLDSTVGDAAQPVDIRAAIWG